MVATVFLIKHGNNAIWLFRYTVHSKLVSFMAPVDKSTWSHESRNQLVNTMFGKSLVSDSAKL